MASDRGVGAGLDGRRARHRMVRLRRARTSQATPCSASRSPSVGARRRARTRPGRARIGRPLVVDADRRRLPRTRAGHSHRTSSSRASGRRRRSGRSRRRGSSSAGLRASSSTEASTAAASTDARRHDGCRRCVRSGLPRRRGRARAGRGRALLCADGRDAVIRISAEVREAPKHARRARDDAVAHGFPPGEGIEVGIASERAVREGGAVPATVGLLDGEIVVGLTIDELARFDASARKVGPRDLAAAAVQGAVGRDDRRRYARRLPRSRHPVHGDRGPRRRAPRLAGSAGRVR